MHVDEFRYVTEAFDTNWMPTVGKNIDEVEFMVAERIGCKYAVALSSGAAALHLCMRLADVKSENKALCSDMAFIWINQIGRYR